MNTDLLKNPIVTIALSVITALIIAIGAAAGLGAFGSSTPPEKTQPESLVVSLPENAKKATPEQVEAILSGKWVTTPNPPENIISFSRSEGSEGAAEKAPYFVHGGVCNGFGVGLVVDKTNATYTVEEGATALKQCEPELWRYDNSVREAFIRGNTIYFDGTHAYFAKGGTGLKLSPAH